ncbi:MAG: ferritin-like domain-containing protein [Pseudanabaena sp. CAN_BIN31]|nr:ferritin-like domain-containing protein [Pseudanabaena sp. CAN_BIN31]
MKHSFRAIAPTIIKATKTLKQNLLKVFASVQYASLALLLMLSLLFVPNANAQNATMSPRQVVEYALTLEKLEADFYRRANSAVQNEAVFGLPDTAKAVLTAYGQDEAQHVTDLSSVLRSIGGNPDAVMIPTNPNYKAILGRDPFASPTDLLQAAQYIEDLGVAAYKGQVPNLQAAGDAGKTVLAGALGIHSVEARHAAGIRELRQSLLNVNVRPWIKDPTEVIYNENRGDNPIPFSSEAFDGYATSDEVLALVSPILTEVQASTTEPIPPTEPSTPSAPVRGLW